MRATVGGSCVLRQCNGPAIYLVLVIFWATPGAWASLVLSETDVAKAREEAKTASAAGSLSSDVEDLATAVEGRDRQTALEACESLSRKQNAPANVRRWVALKRLRLLRDLRRYEDFLRDGERWADINIDDPLNTRVRGMLLDAYKMLPAGSLTLSWQERRERADGVARSAFSRRNPFDRDVLLLYMDYSETVAVIGAQRQIELEAAFLAEQGEEPDAQLWARRVEEMRAHREAYLRDCLVPLRTAFSVVQRFVANPSVAGDTNLTVEEATVMAEVLRGEIASREGSLTLVREDRAHAHGGANGLGSMEQALDHAVEELGQ